MKTAVDGHSAQSEIHGQLTLTAPNQADVQWEKEVAAWEENPKDVKNPFEMTVHSERPDFWFRFVVSVLKVLWCSALSQAAVRKRLAELEAEEAKRGDNIAIHEDISPAVFILTGLELEEAQ